MFIAGLVVGPLAGLVIGDTLKEYPARWLVIASIGVLLVLLVVPRVSVELRIALAFGYFLGLLVLGTPMMTAEDNSFD